MKLRLFLVLIISAGTIFRLANISPFKFYPDAYQSLLVARNIRAYHSVGGTMGEKGMFFPDFFMWTRPVYPLLINSAISVFNDEVLSAQLIAVILGSASIPLAYIYINKVYKDKNTAVLGTLIFSLSFNHIVWGGFILTETTGVFFLLLFLFALFRNINKEAKLADPADFFTGLILSFGVFARYEYIILILPLILYVKQTSPKAILRIINISISFILISSLLASQLYPLSSVIQVIGKQLGVFLKIAGIVLILFSVIITGNFLLPLKYKEKFSRILPKLLSAFIWSATIAVLSEIISGNQMTAAGIRLSGIANFFKQDFLLGFLALIGITVMLKNKAYRNLAVFVFFSSLTIYLFYYRINPAMQRYGTHLIPFLLIPAGLGFKKIIDHIGKFQLRRVLLIFIICTQAVISLIGIRRWDNSDWFNPSYEEQAARQLKNKITDNDNLLVASFPEPYYFFTNLSTYSINDNYPYIYIDDSLNNNQIIISQDMGMYDQFPNFSRFLTENLKYYKTGEFFVGTGYRYAARKEAETRPVTLYETTVGNLKSLIAESR